jgi:hypothetical protein
MMLALIQKNILLKSNFYLFPPSCFGGFSGYLFPFLSGKLFRPSLATFKPPKPAQSNGGRILLFSRFSGRVPEFSRSRLD